MLQVTMLKFEHQTCEGKKLHFAVLLYRQRWLYNARVDENVSKLT